MCYKESETKLIDYRYFPPQSFDEGVQGLIANINEFFLHSNYFTQPIKKNSGKLKKGLTVCSVNWFGVYRKFEQKFVVSVTLTYPRKKKPDSDGDVPITMTVESHLGRTKSDWLNAFCKMLNDVGRVGIEAVESNKGDLKVIPREKGRMQIVIAKMDFGRDQRVEAELESELAQLKQDLFGDVIRNTEDDLDSTDRALERIDDDLTDFMFERAMKDLDNW